MKNRRIQLTKEELIQSLNEQITLLEKSCREFDHGEILVSKHIAIQLRIIWYTKKKQKGLASQLCLTNEVYDSAFMVPNAINFVEMQATPSNERRLFALGGNRVYVPLFDNGPEGIRKIPFEQWWEGNVLSDGEKHTFTRKDLVLAVTNTDGGAHVDPSIEHNYYALTRQGNFGVIRLMPTDDPKVFKKMDSPSPVAVTLRQIGHETLKTLIPEYNYKGMHLYPGPAIAFFSAYGTINKTKNDDN